MRAALAVLAAVLVLAGPAGAAPFGPAEEAAFDEALAFWGHTPSLCTSVTKEVVPLGSLGEGVSGRATQPEGRPVPCGIWIVEGLGEYLCSTMRHEVGHLLGYGHEDPELMAVGPCVVEDPTGRKQAWSEWREERAVCREARGPYRAKCWKALRRERLRILALSRLG